MRYISCEVFPLSCTWYSISVLYKLNKKCEVQDACLLYQVPKRSRAWYSGTPLYYNKLHILGVLVTFKLLFQRDKYINYCNFLQIFLIIIKSTGWMTFLLYIACSVPFVRYWCSLGSLLHVILMYVFLLLKTEIMWLPFWDRGLITVYNCNCLIYLFEEKLIPFIQRNIIKKWLYLPTATKYAVLRYFHWVSTCFKWQGQSDNIYNLGDCLIWHILDYKSMMMNWKW